MNLFSKLSKTKKKNIFSFKKKKLNLILDITEIPICESSISCDNLLCDGNGRPPNPSVVVQVTAHNRAGWIKYGRTEVIEVIFL